MHLKEVIPMQILCDKLYRFLIVKKETYNQKEGDKISIIIVLILFVTIYYRRE